MTTIREYVEKNLGGTTPAREHGHQCVDLSKDFLAKVFGYNKSFGIDYAYQYFNKFYGDFEKIKFDGNPKKCKRGDLIIWDKSKGNGAGHVGIVLGSDDAGIYVLEQNGASGNGSGKNGNEIRIKKFTNFSGILGFGRYKNISSKINEDLFDKIIFENNDYLDETKVKRRNAVKGIYFIFNGNFDGWEQVGISKNLDEAVIRRDFAYILRGYLKNVRGIEVSYDDLINKYNVWSGARGGDFLTSFELNVMLKNMKKIFG